MNKFLLAFVFTMLFSTTVQSKKSCICGDFGTGHIYFAVVGDVCCSSPIDGDSVGGIIRLYVENDGIWALDRAEPIDPNEAQDRCCKPEGN